MNQVPDFSRDNKSSAIPPPVTYNYSSLPWSNIPWDHFEELCYRLLCQLHGIENCSAYGTVGQNQHGIDHFVRVDAPDRYIVYQAKRNSSFLKSDLLKAIKIWEEGKWHPKSDEFIIISTNHFRDTGFIDEFEIQKAKLALQGISLKKIGSHELDTLLREMPSIVEEFFGKEWMERFCSFAALHKHLGGHIPTLDFEKKKYDSVQYYIPRKVTKPNTDDEPFSAFQTKYKIFLPEYVSECITTGIATRLVLKAEAASGKSKELEQIAHLYSINEEGIYPVLVRLKNFHGELGQYISNFYPNWQDVPPERLLLLFDGLDEVPSTYFKDFVSRFNIFLQANQNTHVIASIRTNIFTQEINNDVDASAKLLEIYLGDITERDIINYLNERIPDDRQRKGFEAFAKRKWVKVALYNPFHLSALADLYVEDATNLPVNKVDLIQKIITYKLAKDKRKFDGDLPITNLLLLANRLALFLTLTGKNSIHETRLTDFTELSLTEIRRCSLFKVEEDGLWNTIQFEHNNFQEYLAASQLSKTKWVQLEPILFHITGVNMLKPKMLNTVSYLFTILESDSEIFKILFSKIEHTKITYLLQFERDKIIPAVRLNIFKTIILKGKAEQTYYLNDDFRPEELSEFVNFSSDGFNFLVDELELRGEVNHLYSILDLIYSYRQSSITVASKTRLQKTIVKLILEKSHVFAVYDRAIDVLTKFRFFDQKLLKTIKKCSLIDHKMVRGAAIKYIDEGGFDEEFNYVLHSNVILVKSDYKVMAGLETLYLTYISEHLTEENAESLLTYFTVHKDQIKSLTKTASYQDENRPVNRIYLRLSDLFASSGNQTILNALIEFLIAIHYSSHKKDQWGDPSIFFKKIDDKASLFQLLLFHYKADHLDYFLSDLYSKDLDEMIFEGYKKSKITDKHIVEIRWSLAMRDREAHDHFQNSLLVKFGDKFRYQESVNWDDINVQREKRDRELLQDRNEFLREAKNLYDLVKEIKGEEADEEKLYELEYNEKKEVRQRVNNTLILRVISDYKITGGPEEFLSHFDESGWEWYVFQMVEQWLFSGKKEALPENLLFAAEGYLKKNILPRVNFKDAIKDSKEHSYTIDTYATHLINYYRKKAVSLPESTQLDMLWMDHDGYARYPDSEDDLPQKLFEIIHSSTDPNKFKKRVLLNIADRTLSSRVLTTNAFICRQYQYEEGIPAILALLEQQNFPPRFKEELVEIIIDISEDPVIFEALLSTWKTVRYSWQLEVVKHLAKFPAYNLQLIALIERSDLNPFPKNTEHFWKHQLIVAGIRLGSLKTARYQLSVFGQKLKIFDHSSLKVSDFKKLSLEQPEWLLTQAFRVLDKYIPYLKDSRRNELSEFMEELIRVCAITSQTQFEYAINTYESLIARHRTSNPDVIRLRWYQRKLITDFYAEACSYESEDSAWKLIEALNT